MRDRAFLRLGAVAAMAGGVLGLVANALHPRYDLDDADLFREVAGHGSWELLHAMILLSLLLVIAALLAFGRALHDEAGQALARFGAAAALVGGALALMETVVEGFVFKWLAENYVSAAQEFSAPAFYAAQTAQRLGTGLFAGWTIVLLGAPPILLGLAAVLSRAQPVWISWLALVGGTGAAIAGFMELFEADQTQNDIVFGIASVLVTLWLLVAGAQLWRKSTPVPVEPVVPG